MVDYVVPEGVRIADADRVRLGAYLASGTYMSHQVMRVRVVSAASATLFLNGKYTFTGCTLNSRVGYSSLNAFRIA